MSLKILAFGEVLWDIFENTPCIGGAPLNFCGHCSRLGNDTVILSAVGQDELGRQAINILKDIGVSDRFLGTVDFPTGTVPVTLEHGIPSYEIKIGSAWDNIVIEDHLWREITSFQWDIFYLGTLAQRTAGNRRILERLFDSDIKINKVFFDINLRQQYYSKDVILKSLGWADIVKLNDEEVIVLKELTCLETLADDAFFSFLIHEYNIELLCVTYGEAGAILYQGETVFECSPAENVTVASTVGAGDSFSAALVHGLLNTGSLKKAGQLAVHIAAYVVTHTGALPEYNDSLKSEIYALGIV